MRQVPLAYFDDPCLSKPRYFTAWTIDLIKFLLIFSVIGRKVNMAARLMMHYPDKVTCDDNTFQSSRLPASNFETLATKRMKGLRNVGLIREYIEDKGTAGMTSELASIQC